MGEKGTHGETIVVVSLSWSQWLMLAVETTASPTKLIEHGSELSVEPPRESVTKEQTKRNSTKE